MKQVGETLGNGGKMNAADITIYLLERDNQTIAFDRKDQKSCRRHANCVFKVMEFRSTIGSSVFIV